MERKQYGGFSKPLQHGKFNPGFQRPNLHSNLLKDFQQNKTGQSQNSKNSYGFQGGFGLPKSKYGHQDFKSNFQNKEQKGFANFKYNSNGLSKNWKKK